MIRSCSLRRCLLLGSLLLAATALPAVAQLQSSPTLGSPTSIVEGVLLPDEAFALSGFVEADGHIALVWELPPQGYYLYRKSLSVELPDGTVLEGYDVPQGVMVEDEFFGESEVYFERLLVRLPLREVPESAFTRASDGARELELLVSYQGCAQDKYCYPQQHTALTLELPE